MAEINSIDKTRQDKTRQDKTRQGSNQQRLCQPQFLGSLYGHGPGFAGAVWNPDALSPTLTTMQGGGREPHIMEKQMEAIEIKQATKEGSIKCKVGGCYDASFPDSTTRRGRVQEGGDVAPTLTAGSNENIRYVETIYRIRKLTPRECWRLMGYTDTDFDNAEKVNSNTQLYKQAGNAIVKQVLMAIFAQMIPESARQK